MRKIPEKEYRHWFCEGLRGVMLTPTRKNRSCLFSCHFLARKTHTFRLACVAVALRRVRTIESTLLCTGCPEVSKPVGPAHQSKRYGCKATTDWGSVNKQVSVQQCTSTLETRLLIVYSSKKSKSLKLSLEPKSSMPLSRGRHSASNGISLASRN